MPNSTRRIACACCGRHGRHVARNLIVACYTRYKRAGALGSFQRITQPAEQWEPNGPHGRRMVERYQELAGIRPPLSISRLAFELGVSERQVWRYAAFVRECRAGVSG